MKKPIKLAFLALVVLTILLSGCIPTSTPVPPTITPTVTSSPTATLIPPTSTLVPTATKTKIPTATSRPSTFSLYDDFSSGSASKNFNTALWDDGQFGGNVNWQDEYLVFSGVSVGNELEARSPERWKISQIGTLQADLRIDEVSGGYAFSKIQITSSLSDDNYFWTQCRVGSSDGKYAQIICDVYLDNAMQYKTYRYPIDFGKFYTVAIEVASDGSYVRYYVNGNEVGDYIFKDKEKALFDKAIFNWRIGLWMRSNVTASGAVDNVMVGTSN